MKQEDFFNKLKIKCPIDEEIEGTKETNNLFNIENGEQLTKLYCKSDAVLVADVSAKFIKVSTKVFGINPLYCVSLPGYIWQCALIFTYTKLQTLQEKDMALLLEKIIRGGIGSVIGDRCVKLDDIKKILYVDANNLYGLAMSHSLTYDEIEMSYGHPDLYLNKLEQILNTPDNSDVGFILEVNKNYPDDKKEETKSFPLAPDNKICKKTILVNF